MSLAWISLWGAALLLLPGWVIWRLVGPRGLHPALQVAPAFALSMAVIALVGWSGFVLGIGFSGVKAVLIAVVAIAAVGLAITLWRRRPAPSEPISPRLTLWAALAISLGAGLSALYSGPWLNGTADTFYHLAAIRSITEHGTALAQEVFFSTPVPAADPTSGAWHLALALVSNLSGQDPVSVWTVMTVALPPLTGLAFFALALSITRNGTAALIASGLYMVLSLSFDFRAGAYPNRFGLLLGWLAVAFVMRFVENGSWRELFVATPIAFGASAVHPLLSPFLMIVLACGVAAAILVRSPSWTRIAVAAAVVAAAALPLLLVNASTINGAPPFVAMAVTSALPLRIIHHPWNWVWPSFWFFSVGIALGTAFAVSLVRLWRTKDVGAGLVIAAVLVIPAAAVTPLFATTPTKEYVLARVAGVLSPIVWLSWGWGLALAISALRSRASALVVAVLLVSAVAIGSAFYVGPLARYIRPVSSPTSFASSRSTNLTVLWRDRLAAIDALPASAVLLAEPKMAYAVGGLTGIEVVAVPVSHAPHQTEVIDGPERRTDALDAVQGRLDSTSLAGVIEHYGVTDVLVDTAQTDAAAWAQLANAEILSPIASGANWRLYRYDPQMLDAYLNLPTQEGPGPDLGRSGVSPQTAVAGRAVFARLEWNQGNAGNARLQADAVGSADTFGRTVPVGGAGSSETLALPIPSDAAAGRYMLSLVLSGGRSLSLGQFDVGRLYQAEDMGGVVAGASSGWTIVGSLTYQGDLAAIATQQGSAAQQAIPPVAAGSYCVAVRVYDSGTNLSNALEVGLGDAKAQVSWSGAVPGMRLLRTPIALDRTGGTLGFRLLQHGQGTVVVDSLEFYPLEGGDCGSD